MNRRVSISEVFDTNPFSPYQAWVSFLCFCVTFLEGFDLMLIGVTMPSIAQFLHARPGALGLAVAAGQVGPLIGNVVLGALADRWGRKRTLVVGAIIFGVFSAGTAYITSLQQLALFRFLAGIGLGGATPNGLAYGSEYAPTRMRATLTTTMYAGVAAGSVVAGLAGAYLLPAYGWQSLFFMGGTLPIIVGLLIAFLLPETPGFLLQRGRDKEEVRRIVSRIAPALAKEEGVEFYSAEEKLPGVPVKHLFLEGRAFITIMLWLLFFACFVVMWFLLGWAPTLLKKSGATVQQFSIAFACVNIGSVFAILLTGRLMDKTNPFNLLKAAFILSCISLVAFGLFSTSSFLVIAIVCVIAGFFVFAGNAGLMALATILYPLDIRSSGIGCACAAGKVGSVFALAMGGLLLSHNWSTIQICNLNGLIALIVVGLLMVLHRHLKRSEKSADLARAAAN
jgi:AAHS family 4-hydroxybenzoate transporter-like MFS transporter